MFEGTAGSRGAPWHCWRNFSAVREGPLVQSLGVFPGSAFYGPGGTCGILDFRCCFFCFVARFRAASIKGVHSTSHSPDSKPCTPRIEHPHSQPHPLGEVFKWGHYGLFWRCVLGPSINPRWTPRPCNSGLVGV